VKTVDRIFGWLLLIGGLLHGMGSLQGYGKNHEMLLWALCASLAVLLLAAINLLRVGRPQDRALAWISFLGCIGWLVAAIAFGRLIGNIFDFRPLTHEIITIVLAIFSLRRSFAGMARLHNAASSTVSPKESRPL
jgi:uncharacterized membrane protein YjjB (DUF3815 family)